MKHWTIGKHITVGFTAVLLITVAIATFAYIRLTSIEQRGTTINTDTLPGLAIMSKIQSNLGKHYSNIERMLLTKDSGLLTTLDNAENEISDRNSAFYKEYELTVQEEQDRKLFNQVVTARTEYTQQGEKTRTAIKAGKPEEALALFTQNLAPAFEKYDHALEELVEYNRAGGMEDGKLIQETISSSKRWLIICATIAVLMSVAVSLAMTRHITKKLAVVSEDLASGAEQITSAASQVSSAGQSLAEGASEQAATIEETSASIEEMTGMTKNNAENARSAKQLSNETRTAADNGMTDMAAMKEAMDDIKASSDDISKIIRTIDEIAFQTNILALNAAVEAARAGEAGAGFAVVADEVRNLAQRSAQSAKETAEKIEVAINKSERGVQLSSKVASSLTEIAEKARKVDTLVADIASASDEQAQGAAQLNTGIGQINSVTQSNASHAEETASASEELNAQANSLRDSVSELVALAGRSKNSRSSASTEKPVKRGKIKLPALTKPVTITARKPAPIFENNGRGTIEDGSQNGFNGHSNGSSHQDFFEEVSTGGRQ